MCSTASQFSGHYCCSRSRRTDKTQHSSLNQYSGMHIREYIQNSGQKNERKALYEKQHGMPSARLELTHINLTECEKKHQKNQQRLQYSHSMFHKRFCRLQERYVHIYKIKYYPHRHSYRQSPVLNKSNDIHNQV